MDMVGFILHCFGLRRSLVYSSQPSCQLGEGSYASLLLSVAAVQILTFCVSVLRGTVDDKMKNISIDRRHPPPEG